MNKKDYIYFIRASVSSMICAGVDLLIFYLLCHGSKEFIIITIATIISRCISAVVNFLINKYWAFKSDGKTKKEIILFIILFVVKMLLSSLLVWVFKFVKINQTLLKALIDFILFFGSFIIQKKLIFQKNI